MAFDSHQVLSKWSSASKSQVAQGFSRFGRSYWRRKVKGGVRVVCIKIMRCTTDRDGLVPETHETCFSDRFTSSPFQLLWRFYPSTRQIDRCVSFQVDPAIKSWRDVLVCSCQHSTNRHRSSTPLSPIIMEVEKMAIYLKGNYCWRLGVRPIFEFHDTWEDSGNMGYLYPTDGR